jgi:hypothetical protein
MSMNTNCGFLTDLLVFVFCKHSSRAKNAFYLRPKFIQKIA